MSFTGAVPFFRVRVGRLLGGMFTPKNKSAPAESRQRTDPLLVQRLRVLVWLALSSWVLFAARDLWCDSVPIIQPHLIRLAFGAVFVGVLLVLRSPRSTRWTVWLGVLTAAGICFESAAVGVFRHDAVTPHLNSVVVTMVAAALMPLGLWPQLAAVLSAELSILWNAYQLTGGFGPAVSHTALVAAAAFICSVYVAYELERKRRAIEEANIELRAKEEHFRLLLEKAMDLITIVNPDGTIRYQSPASERIFGQPVDVMIGKNVFDFVHPDDHASMIEAFTRRLHHQERGEILEFRVRHRDGSWRTLEALAGSVRDDSGAINRDCRQLT